jgi:hypothetical protein
MAAEAPVSPCVLEEAKGSCRGGGVRGGEGGGLSEDDVWEGGGGVTD